MSAQRWVRLLCDHPDCEQRRDAAGTAAAARTAAVAAGWSTYRVSGLVRDRCPEHPHRPPLAARPQPAVIRLYAADGRLLYVATTNGPLPARLRALKAHDDWYALVDPSRTVVDYWPAGTDLVDVKDRIVRAEHPLHFRDPEHPGRKPYLRVTRVIPPTLRPPPTMLERLRAR